ncbi:MAG: hypothetical protein HQ546_08130, partial [Planctomycetes bacterium]|nr:hypothetical protein [Planctomycetota bacterium]
VWQPKLPPAYQMARQWAKKLLDKPDVLLGWNANVEYDLPVPGKLSLLIPPTTMPEQIPEQLADFPSLVDHVHLQSQPEPVERLGLLGDLALRYAYTRAAGADRIYIDPPWHGGPFDTIEPTETFIVARTLAAYLGEAECLGVARLNDSAVAVIFRTADGEGRMLVYGRGDNNERAETEIDLPSDAYVVDLWGRRQQLRRCGDRAVLSVTALPIIVAGCDGDSLALRAFLRFVPDVLESVFQDHTVQVRFTNPCSKPVAGTVSFAAAQGWSVRPRLARFNLKPGETWTEQLTVRFPYGETAGLKRMDTAIEIEAPKRRTIQAPAFFYLSLKDVAFDVLQFPGADGGLEVVQSIVNRGDKPISYTCFAQVPGRARQSSPLYALPPGARAERTFSFDNWAELRGQTLRTGLRQISGPGVLNHSAVIR